METILIILVVIGVLILLFGLVTQQQKKKQAIVPPIADDFKKILLKDVAFYSALDAAKKQEFENRMMHFLATTRITGVKTTVEEIDKVYIAASAIIPIFGFAGWEYNNLNEVLLYPDSFDHDFAQTGEGRNTLGVVGDGAYNNIMILSQHELRQAFINKTGKENTAIHEFVHLLDKTDGTVDGVPEYFVSKQYAVPWLQLIHKEIKKILANRSDINPYGATNEGEFFAVVSEYFFERPDLLESKHPELYELLSQLFKQQPHLPGKTGV